MFDLAVFGNGRFEKNAAGNISAMQFGDGRNRIYTLDKDSLYQQVCVRGDLHSGPPFSLKTATVPSQISLADADVHIDTQDDSTWSRSQTGGLIKSSDKELGGRILIGSKSTNCEASVLINVSGLGATAISALRAENTIKFRNLSGHRFADIFGTYYGVQLGGAVALGARASILRNSAGVEISDLQALFGGIGIQINAATLKVHPLDITSPNCMGLEFND
jgi:hypothetical protein